MLMASLARNTVDDSEANRSSIITVWRDPDPKKDLQVVLTGDCVGYRVLQLMKPPMATEGKRVNVFQVPHHGSARNSLPLEQNVLPPTADITLVKQVFAFRVLLGYHFDRANWDHIIVNQEMGDDRIYYFNATFNDRKISFEGIMLYMVPATVEALNKNKNILLPPSCNNSRAEYCYEQVKTAVAVIEQNVKEKKDMENVFKFSNEHFFGKHSKRLYTVIMKAVQQDSTFARNIADVCHKQLLDKNNRLLDEITALQVAQFYKSFHAKLYYISTVEWQHHHPHQSLLNGLIQASVAKENKCTILLASGDILRLRKLPDPKQWSRYVTFQYLTEMGHATIDSENGTVENAAVYVPNHTDKELLKRTREELDRGSTAKFFRKRVRRESTTYKITTTTSGGDEYFLFVNSNSEFELHKDEIIVNVTFRSGNETFLTVSYNAHSVWCYIERLTYNSDKYRLYDIESEESRLYLYRKNTGGLVWQKRQSYPYSVLLIFDISATPRASRTSKLLMMQSHFLELSKSQYSFHKMAHKQSFSGTTASDETVSLESYLHYWGITDAPGSIKADVLLSLLMGHDISDQFTCLKGLPPDIQSLVDQVIQCTMEKTTTITFTIQGEVSLASLSINLPKPPPSFLGAAVEKTQLDVENPEGGNLSVKLIVQWSQWQDIFNLTPLFDLSKRDISLPNYLKNIKYPAEASDVFFSDVILLLLDGFATGAAAYMALPLTLASEMLTFKVDNIRSRVKVVKILGDLLVENATIYAVPKPANDSLQLGPFQVSLQELAAHYLANSTTITYTGKVKVSYQSMSKQASFQIVLNLSSTAEVQFAISETSLSKFLSFLKLPSNLADIYVPLIGTLLHGTNFVNNIGFILKQGVYDSSDLQLHSIFFQVSEGNLLQYLPSGVRPSDLQVKVSIFQPKESTRTIGLEANFIADVHSSSQEYKLLCNFSILPVSTTDGPRSTGYICTCLLSTSSINYTGSVSVGSLMAVLGLKNTIQAISSSLPVLRSLLNNISLKEVSLTYNSGEVSQVDTFYIGLAITHWNIFSQISIHQFEIQLQFSKGSGWSAYSHGNVQFGKEYSISMELTLPTDTTAGSLSFKNSYEEFTMSEFMTYLGLPALSEVPVLGSVLDITVRSASLGLETGESGKLSLYGFKAEIYIGSVKMNFQLSDVNAILAYNKSVSGHEVSFSISGFINKKAFVEVRYEPKRNEFTGRLQVSTNNTLSTDECVKLFINQEGLLQNSAYAAVSSDTSVNVFLTLKYLSDQQDVLVKQFSVSLLSVLSFGPMVLRKLQLLYKNTHDGTKPDSITKNTILPVGSSLHILAVLQQTNGDFGLQLSFDCNVMSPDSKVFTATIQPSSDKSLTLRSFLSLFCLTQPELPESGADSKPSTDGFLDLELNKGSLTFSTAPFKMKAFEVTTRLSSSGWALLSNPNITLRNICLSVSYTKERGISVTLYGSVRVGNLEVQVAGTKVDKISKFHLVLSNDLSQSSYDLMGLVHTFSPASKQAIAIQSDAGIPQKLEGSLAALTVEISPQNTSLSLHLYINLPDWSIDVGFSQFTATDLHLKLLWNKESQGQQTASFTSFLTEYLLTLSANLNFGDIPAVVELEIGSQEDTIVQASINPAEIIDLGVITDQTLGFLHHPSPGSQSGKDKSLSFSDLLPTGIVPFHFTKGYLQFNLTQKLCLVFGSVKDLGSCLLVAGKLEEKSGFGYAVTLSLSSFSSLLPPLATIEDIIIVKDVNASIINLDGIKVESLVNAVRVAKQHISNLPHPPFINLPLKPNEKIGEQNIIHGTSLYSVLDFSTDSALFSNLLSIQQSKTMPGDLILYAQVTKDSTGSLFLAYVSSLTLFGFLNFTDIEFRYTPSRKSAVILTGDISIPALSPHSKFHGSLQAGEKEAHFSLTGSNQPKNLQEPLGMFGISILNPDLQLHYEFQHFSSTYELSGSVDFYPPSNETSDLMHASAKREKPSVKLTAKCIFIKGTPKVIDITLLTLNTPLTVADVVATIFDASWNMKFLNIGFYSGRLYYAKLDDNESLQDMTDSFQYKSGYHMSCKTFIFTEDFQFNIDMSIPLDKTGFSISGSTLHPLDFGLFKVSTGDKDSTGFLDKGPSLSYSYTHHLTSLSLEAGITFLNVTVAKTTIQYNPKDSLFVFTVTYPKEFLGVKSPSISFTWSKEGGFRIRNSALPNPSLQGLDDKLITEVKTFLAKPTSKGCSAIVGMVFDKVITSKFYIQMSTADKTKWKADDLFVFQLHGTYDIGIAGDIEISSVDLPDIIVHLPRVQDLTMSDVATYVLNTVIENAGLIVQQLVEQPDRLAKLIGAMALKELGKQALIEAIDSFVCRDVEKSDIKVSLDEEVNESENVFEEGEVEMENASTAFDDLIVPSVKDAGFAAWAESAAEVAGAALGIGRAVGGLSSLFNAISKVFGGHHDLDKYKQKCDEVNQESEHAKNEIEKVLKLSPPMHTEVSDDVLDVSWVPLPKSVPNVEYALHIDIESAVDPYSHFTHNTRSSSWQMRNDCLYTASKVTISISVTCTVTGNKGHTATFTGKSKLTHSISHTAALPPPKTVTITVDSSHALTGHVQGISEDSKAVKIELIGVNFDGENHVISRQVQQPGSVADISYTFIPKDYMQFSGKQFIVQSQSLRGGLQNSVFTKSTAVNQAPLLKNVTHTLPLFSGGSKAIDVRWSPNSESITEVERIICEIVSIDSSSRRVILTQSVGKPLPDKVPFVSRETVTNSQLYCQAAFIPSRNDLANSAYKVDSISFKILPAPTKLLRMK